MLVLPALQVLERALPAMASDLMELIDRHAAEGAEHRFAARQLLIIASQCLVRQMGYASEVSTQQYKLCIHSQVRDTSLHKHHKLHNCQFVVWWIGEQSQSVLSDNSDAQPTVLCRIGCCRTSLMLLGATQLLCWCRSCCVRSPGGWHKRDFESVSPVPQAGDTQAAVPDTQVSSKRE